MLIYIYIRIYIYMYYICFFTFNDRFGLESLYIWYLYEYWFCFEFMVYIFMFVPIYPIGSMYGIFTYIYHKSKPNVGQYTIHGSYGYIIYKLYHESNDSFKMYLAFWWILDCQGSKSFTHSRCVGRLVMQTYKGRYHTLPESNSKSHWK